MIESQAFLEYAIIYQHYYGTAKEWVLEKLAAGIDVLLEIDWQGAQQIRRLFPEAILIFILPPSLDTLQPAITKSWPRPNLSNRRKNGRGAKRNQPFSRIRLFSR